jgi:hypothetical protein
MYVSMYAMDEKRVRRREEGVKKVRGSEREREQKRKR